MKKFTKRAVTVGITLLIVGIALCISGVVIGVEIAPIKQAVISRVDRFLGNVHIGGTDIVIKNPRTEPIKLEENYNLLIEAGACELEIKKSPDDTFYLDGDTTYIKWEVDEESKEVRVAGNNDLLHNDYKNIGKTIIYVPEGYCFDNVEVEVGAGELMVDYIEGNDFTFDVSAGEMTVKDVICDKIDAEISAGEMNFENISTNILEADCSGGQISVSGDIKEKAVLDCSMGEVILKLERENKDYNYEVDCSMGEVEINGTSLRNGNIDNDADTDITVDCSMGEINITTK